MVRSTPSLLVLIAALAAASPALAADPNDWNGEDTGAGALRQSYAEQPADWNDYGDSSDSVSFDAGLRYWRSYGSMSFGSGPSLSTDTTADVGELHLRIDDHQTNTYASVIAGYSARISGTGSSGDIADGHISYIGGDFGWYTAGDSKGSGIGPFVGYLYLNESPDTGRVNYTTLQTGSTVPYTVGTGQTNIPGASAPNYLDTHMARLGVSGKLKLGEFFDVSGEVAAVPYALVSGSVGVDDPTFSTAAYGGAAQPPYSSQNGNISSMRSSATTVDGWGYGGAAEGWIGMHPTENLGVRLGGRFWYLQGTADTSYSRATIVDPQDLDTNGTFETPPTVTTQKFLETNSPFKMMRYGLLAELTYKF